MPLRPAVVLDRLWQQVFNERDLGAAAELLDDGVVLRVSGLEFAGRDHLVHAIAQLWHDPFPDLRVEVLQRVVQGDWVCEVVEFTGTHTGAPYHSAFLDTHGIGPIAPTGRGFTFTQSTFSRIGDDGRIVEMWEDWDRLRMLVALGVGLRGPEGA